MILDEETTNEMKIAAFRWRTRSEKFDENYKGGKNETVCILCNKHKDSQETSFQCNEVRKRVAVTSKYEELFQPKIPKILIQQLMKIVEIREQTACRLDRRI